MGQYKAKELISQLETVRIMAQDYVDMFGRIDEVSFLFASSVELERFTHEAQVLGMEFFDSTIEVCTLIRQRVRANERFRAIFNFLRWPEADWRIEAMVFEGQATLHQAALDESGGEPVLIHASFKCPSLEEYLKTCEKMARLFSPGVQASYQNSYGQFSYFGVHPWYLKPRVNLRD